MKLSLIHLLLLPILLLFSCGKKNNETIPERKNITETVFASGTLEPENKYNLTAQTEGYLIEIKFDSGDTVKAGQVLAIIDNKTNAISASSAENLLNLAGINASNNGPTLKQAQQNVNLLRDKANQDSTQYTRYQKLFQSNSVSKLELENAKLAFEASKTNYDNAEQNYKLLKQQTEQQLIIQRSQRDVNAVSNENNDVRAVVGGKIYKRLKEAGDYVRRGDVIAVIGDASDLYARLNIDESNIANIKTGQKATIQLNSNKGIIYEGTVSRILPAFEDLTQSFICEVRFNQKPALQISGTQLQANIIIGNKNNALVIPRNYLDYGNKVMVKGNKEPVQ
ncbi:MAG: HlyD family efflux transporter periplasmic adaptor subunit, partial [Bacteroidia bacterium]|nr:HlyD family efflux transporter periplasmic adaptor subunit [Bacteroidia bacterium]